MVTPQEPGLERSGLSAADPASAKGKVGSRPRTSGRTGRIPADNQPGHHPDHEQDKPLDKFVARAEAQAREAQEHRVEPQVAEHRVAQAEPRAVESGSRSEAGAESDASTGSSPAEVFAGGAATGAGPATGALAVEATGRSGLSALRLDAIVPTLVPVLGLVDAARRPSSQWDEIGASKLTWMARIALVPVAGPWAYATSVRPRLDAGARARALAGA